MQILKGGVLYFALVFEAGFVLGTVRTFWVVLHIFRFEPRSRTFPTGAVDIVSRQAYVSSKVVPKSRRTLNVGRRLSCKPPTS